MSIMRHLSYQPATGKILGFEDDGKNRENKVADSASVIMVQGLTTKWKPPLMYTFSKGATKASKLKFSITDILGGLEKIGLIPKVLVMDQGSNFLNLFKLFTITIEKPFIEHSKNKVFVMLDPPHSLKSVRNNFQKYKVFLMR